MQKTGDQEVRDLSRPGKGFFLSFFVHLHHKDSRPNQKMCSRDSIFEKKDFKKITIYGTSLVLRALFCNVEYKKLWVCSRFLNILYLNWKIDINWLNLSFESFKIISMKKPKMKYSSNESIKFKPVLSFKKSLQCWPCV